MKLAIPAGQLARWAIAARNPNEWAVGGTDAFPEGHVLYRPERFVVGTTGRQVGKTDEMSDALDRAMNAKPHPRDKKPESPPDVGLLAPTFAKARIGLDRYMEMLVRVYGKGSFRSNDNEHELTILDPAAGKKGAKLTWLSAQEMVNVIGNTFTFLAVDEAQLIPDMIWDKIRPTLDVRVADCLIFGTPDTEINQTWFQGLWQAGQDPLDTNVHSFTIPSWQAPWMDIDSILDAKKKMGDREFRRLYGGEWIDDQGLMFPKQVIAAASLGFVPEIKINHRYFMAVDLAIHDDFTVAMIGDPITKTAVYYERWNDTDPTDTYDRLEGIYERFGQPRIWVDATGFGAVAARDITKFAKGRVTPIIFNAQQNDEFNKMIMLRQLGSDMEHRNVMFPHDWEDLKREFGNFIYMRTPAGKLTAGARNGAHDDIVMTFAMLNHAFRTRGRRFAEEPHETFNYLSGRGMSTPEGLSDLERLIRA